VEYLDVAEATSFRIGEIVDRYILPVIAKTSRGLYLTISRTGGAPEADVYDSVFLGATLMKAGNTLSKDSYAAIGRALLYAALDLADAEGFLPERILIQDGNVETAGEPIPPQSVYGLLPGSDYTPKEYPLYAFLYPGSWVWTVSRIQEVKIEDTQYRFRFSFPVGDTHYLLIQGIRPFASMIMHQIPWKSDPEYFRYTDGWVYDEESQTLFVKLTHRLAIEELLLNY
jgi:hypothetical protein